MSTTEKSVSTGSFMALVILFFFLYKTPQPINKSFTPSVVNKPAYYFPLGKVVLDITADLIKDGLIRDKNALSFELTNSRLLINGVCQPDQIWKKLHAKYLRCSPYPIRPEYKDEPGFGIFFNNITHVYGLGTKPPNWNA